jgi:hypothetical protein
MGKTKLSTMGTNNTRLLTIHNWDKISIGVENANTMEAESFYAVRIGRLGAVIVHREIDSEDTVIVEISDETGNRVRDVRVWIGSVVFSNPVGLLELFMDRLTEWGWI